MVGMHDQKLLQKLALYIRPLFYSDARKGWKIRLETSKTDHSRGACRCHYNNRSSHSAPNGLKKKQIFTMAADMDPWTTVFYNEFFPRTEATKRKDKFLEI